MRKSLKKIIWWCNALLALVLITLENIPLAISSLVVIVLSPFLAFVIANGFKLKYSTPESWWELYKITLIRLCTDDLPIVVFNKHS